MPQQKNYSNLLIKTIPFILVTVSLLGWLGYLFADKLFTPSYNQCQVDYGNVVNEWEGSADSQWNQKGYHYVSRLYKISASSESWFIDNRVDNLARSIQVNGDSGGCNNSDNGYVDTTSNEKMYKKARPVGVRLGMPALDNNNDGIHEAFDTIPKVDEGLNTLVKSTYGERAAAFVDDAAIVNIKDTKEKNSVLWCQNGYASSHDCSQETLVSSAAKANNRGYLFTEDNCPFENCDKLSGWYKVKGLAGTVDLNKMVGITKKGYLEPFYLHTTAQNNRHPTVGAWTILTYKYLSKPQISANITFPNKRYEPGEEYKFNLTISKKGPPLGKLDVILKNNSKLKGDKKISISEEQISKLNTQEELKIDVARTIADDATPGDCYSYNIDFSAIDLEGLSIAVKAIDDYYCLIEPEQPKVVIYTYSVSTRGDIQSNPSEFYTLAADTLADSRGWKRAGVAFSRVNSGGDFVLILASPDAVDNASPGCDATWSCRSGNQVLINDSRWREATRAWNSAGGNIRDYRHMVVNHEVGHRLGFGHASCPASGAKAPVMQQQSIDLEECTFNPWPTQAEIDALKARI